MAEGALTVCHLCNSIRGVTLTYTQTEDIIQYDAGVQEHS